MYPDLNKLLPMSLQISDAALKNNPWIEVARSKFFSFHFRHSSTRKINSCDIQTATPTKGIASNTLFSPFLTQKNFNLKSILANLGGGVHFRQVSKRQSLQ